MLPNKVGTLRVLALLVGMMPALAGATGGFSILEPLHGGERAEAKGVSADGAVIVGAAEDGRTGKSYAVIWTERDGAWKPIALSSEPSDATGISADGTVVVGEILSKDGYRAFRWTESGGMQMLGGSKKGSISGAARVSGDGKVVVGFATDGSPLLSLIKLDLSRLSYDRAFRWTESSGMVSLGGLNGGKNSHATGVSADGSVVVGSANDGKAGEDRRAFVWVRNSGMMEISKFFEREQKAGGSPEDLFSSVSAVSASGEVMMVSGRRGAANSLFRWKKSSGLTVLQGPEGSENFSVNAISADGGVVVGNAYGSRLVEGDPIYKPPRRESRAIRWDGDAPVNTIEQWLLDGGVTVLPHLHFRSANAVNADGTVAVGQLTNHQAYRAWVR